VVGAHRTALLSVDSRRPPARAGEPRLPGPGGRGTHDPPGEGRGRPAPHGVVARPARLRPPDRRRAARRTPARPPPGDRRRGLRRPPSRSSRTAAPSAAPGPSPTGVPHDGSRPPTPASDRLAHPGRHPPRAGRRAALGPDRGGHGPLTVRGRAVPAGGTARGTAAGRDLRRPLRPGAAGGAAGPEDG